MVIELQFTSSIRPPRRRVVGAIFACVVVGLACSTGQPLGFPQNGQTVTDTVHSPALEGNPLGIPPDRDVVVYLPPSYSTDTSRRYPVVYALHGNGFGRDLTRLDGSPTTELMGSLIREGVIREMIVVRPAAWYDPYGGSHYANSTVSGNWADFIVRDLVAYIDDNYRTLPRPESRGLTGTSMGGRGALDLALKFPGVFGVLYARSSGQMGFHTGRPIGTEAEWRALLTSRDPQPSAPGLWRLLGFSVAFAPNPDAPPYYADLPFVLDGDSLRPVEEVWKRWAAFDPVQIAEHDAEALRELSALYLACGTSDLNLDAHRLFSAALTRQNIPHVYEEYEGGHNDKHAERIRTNVLPMFSSKLVFELPGQIGGAEHPDLRPTYADVAYGPHERNVLDFYQAESDDPTAVILYFHGGGFASGDKSEYELPMLPLALESGISVVTVNYRFVDGQTTMLPTPQRDGARAVQFLRARAAEWNLDPTRIAAFGGSAGAGIAMWIAFHDELADPTSPDPVERRSSRLRAVGSFAGQTTYDLVLINQVVGGRAIEHPANLPLFGLTTFDEALRPTPALQSRYDESSPVAHLTPDDPPLFMAYSGTTAPLPPDSPSGAGMHHAGFGKLAKERMDALGIENVLFFRDDEGSDGDAEMLAFFMKHLGVSR